MEREITCAGIVKDEKGEAKVGDRVRIQETRPLSKLKRWRLIEVVERNAEPEKVAEEVMTLLDLAKKWDFEISLGEAQNLMSQVLEECVGSLEKCWWEDGTPKLFSPNLITLAEKLGFHVEKYLLYIYI